MFTEAARRTPEDLEIPLRYGRLLAVLPERAEDAADVLVAALRKAAARVEAVGPEDVEAVRVRDRASEELQELVLRMPHRSSLGSEWNAMPRASEDREEPHDAAARALVALTEVGPPSVGVVWELGQIHALYGRNAEAELSYRQALALDPSSVRLQVDANFNLAVVVGRLGRHAEAISLYRSVVDVKPDEVRAWEYLGDSLLRHGDAEGGANAYREAAELHASRNASFRFLVLFHQPDEVFWDRCASEVAALEHAATLTGEASESRLVAASPFVSQLPGILQQLRDVERNTTWQVARLMECGNVFGAQESTKFTCAYGISWFDTAWQPVMAHPLVEKALSAARADPNARVVVLGSALGEHCLYTSLLLGLKCVGYDLLCDTNVAVANGLVPRGAEAEFHCADAVEGADFTGAYLVWALDVVWGPKLHRRIEQRLAAELPAGAVAVLYRPPAWRGVGALTEHADALRIGVSWNTNLSATFLEKQSPDTAKRDEF